eukprot:7280139-Pyramimonas_sp.AAC.1
MACTCTRECHAHENAMHMAPPTSSREKFERPDRARQHQPSEERATSQPPAGPAPIGNHEAPRSPTKNPDPD